MLKAVVFDLDGTLIDSTPAIMDSFGHTFNEVGIAMPDYDTIYKTISMALEDQFKALCDEDPDHLTQIFRKHYFPTCTQGTELLPTVEESIKKLHATGVPLAIATSKSVKGSEIILEHLGMLSYFEFIIGGDTVKHYKPHPECLELSMDRLGLDSDEIIFIGDTEFDTEAAYRAGVDCLVVATGYASRDDLEQSTADRVFDQMDTLIDHLMTECLGNSSEPSAVKA